MTSAHTVNAAQIEILNELYRHGSGHFDRWLRLIVDGQPITKHHSTVPYTLFRKGYIECNGEQVKLTAQGKAFLMSLYPGAING